MANTQFKLLRNDILGGGSVDSSMNYFNTTKTMNQSVSGSTTLYLINSSLSTSAGSIKPHDWDDSNNGNSELRGSIFRGSNADDTSGFRLSRSTKYNRSFGALLGSTSPPTDGRTQAWLHGVKGLEMNWMMDGHWGWFDMQHLGIVYTNKRRNSSRLFYMPLIYEASLYPGATMNYTGANLANITKANYPSDNKPKGRICIRGTSSMCSVVDDKNLIMNGIWFAAKQGNKSDANKTYYVHFYNAKPMFSRDGVNYKNKAIMPGKEYRYDDALNGYMAIA